MSHFNDVANTWDNPENINRSQSFALAIRQKLRASHFKNILEFGCGTGLLSGQFYDQTERITGIDTSSEMLQVFKKKDAQEKVTTLLIDLSQSEIPGHEKFDLILSSMAFHHIIKPQLIMEKFLNRLSPEGQIFIIDLEKEDGTFHPDNQKMGVQHYGFSKSEIQNWLTIPNHPFPEIQTVFQINKNNRNYGVFLSMFT
jgi:2-polyprenyl-3-methyl-5-hydroxy-6-metoxy-1,4-benzoquinol methylase